MASMETQAISLRLRVSSATLQSIYRLPLRLRRHALYTYPLGPAAPPPDGLVSLVSTAEKLGADFDFIRVDLYLVGDKVFLGEMTPYAIGGIEPFDPRGADAWLGSFWTLPDVSPSFQVAG